MTLTQLVWAVAAFANFWAEMFGDLNAEERRRAVDYLDTLPAPVVAAIGRAFAKAAKEGLR